MRVLVTGGTRRIGAAITRHLIEAGHQVVVHRHRAHDDDEALPGIAGVVEGELGDPETAPRLIAEARALFGGPVDGLVNNASMFAFDQLPLADFSLLDRHMRVNLGGPVLLAQALAGQGDLGEGAVVNLLDQKVGNLNPDFFTYSCSKIALAGATEMLARALAPRVRVNALSPGLTLPSLDQSAEEFAAVSGENLLGRPVDLADIARTVEHLLVTRSITGQNVFVDCGQRFLPRDGDVMFRDRGRPHV